MAVHPHEYSIIINSVNEMLKEFSPTLTVFMRAKYIKAVAVRAIKIYECTATSVILDVVSISVTLQVLFQGFVFNVIHLTKESDAILSDLGNHTLWDLPFLAVYATMYLCEDIPKAIIFIRYWYSGKWIKPVTDAGKQGLLELKK